MAYPAWPPRWAEMSAAGFAHVVCLTADRFPYDPAPLNRLHAVRLADLYGGLEPGHPEEERRRIGAAVSACLRPLLAGEGVVVHCAGGTGRTGTVLGCILRSLGFSGGEAIHYLDRLHRARGQDGWPESGWQARVVAEYIAERIF
jgi:protein-tyrosine phosphatase